MVIFNIFFPKLFDIIVLKSSFSPPLNMMCDSGEHRKNIYPWQDWKSHLR